MQTQLPNKKWLRFFKRNPNASIRLFCLPYGGTGPSIYREWANYFGDDVEVIGILYPGRESRIAETLTPDIRQMASDLLAAIQPLLDKPYVVFGHSMGALIGYELVARVSARQLPMPRHLFVSGTDAPHYEEQEPIHHLPEDEFLDALIELNGMPDEVLQNRELLSYALPIIRSDFAACAEYWLEESNQLDCPLSAYGGTRDSKVEIAHVEEWSQYTSKEFACRIFDGDHFFLHSHEEQILSELHDKLL